MPRPTIHLALPLLEKELIEQAARKRTYVVRVVYAALLFFIAFLFLYETLAAGATSPLTILGSGRNIFLQLVGLQFAGVYFFMPAITCGVVTQEKERDSLQLLFLTRLGPWAILFEKLLGRMVPMFSFLLLALPLLGFAYSLGGISPRLLWTGVWMLVLATIQMGTLALMCSAFFRTTVGAFVASYVIAVIMFFGPYIAWMIVFLLGYLLGLDFEAVMRGLNTNFSPAMFILAAVPFFGLAQFLANASIPGGLGFWSLFGHSAIVLTTSGVFLLLARKCLVSRAFLPPRNYLLDFLKGFDRQRETEDSVESADEIVIETDSDLLPADEPIAWRESTKRSLGRSRYLVRILLFVEVPLVLFCFLLLLTNVLRPNYSEIPRIFVSLAVFMLWGLAVLTVSVMSSSLIAAERSRQTLEVLCTTPLTGREIVLQKFRGVWRLILVLLVPFGTLFLCEAWLREFATNRYRYSGYPSEFSAPGYLASSFLSAAIYLPLVAWLSLLIGLKVRSQARAMIASMAAIAAWCVGPYIFCFMPVSIMQRGASSSEGLLACITLASPMSILFWNEIENMNFQRLFGEFVWLPFILNYAAYGVALAFFRNAALNNADRWLGRSEGTAGNLAIDREPRDENLEDFEETKTE